MKQVNPRRFGRKEEEIDFHAEPITNKRQAGESVFKTAGDPPKRPQDASERPMVHHISIPQKRVRIRHAFDIFEDQLDALKKIQAAHRDTHGTTGTPSLSDMTREAFDAFIRDRIKGLKNIDILHDGKF
jgi:triphosphoribosyl-dephospho-CoA synthetase